MGCALRLLLPAVIWGIVAAATGCSSSSGDNGYRGISGQYPTGSRNISSDNLVAAFDMETITSNGLLQDFSPHGHHSVIMGTAPAAGIFGDARRFKIPADRIDLPETPAFDINGPLSLALWFRVDALNLHQHILAVDDKFVVWINQLNHIRFTDTRGNGLEMQESLEAGRWYSLAAVFDGTAGMQLTQENIRLYLDGELIQTILVGKSSADPPAWNPGYLFPSDAAYIGFESHQGEPLHQELPFVGVIDEVLIFSRSLDLLEIMAHADADQ